MGNGGNHQYICFLEEIMKVLSKNFGQPLPQPKLKSQRSKVQLSLSTNPFSNQNQLNIDCRYRIQNYFQEFLQVCRFLFDLKTFFVKFCCRLQTGRGSYSVERRFWVSFIVESTTFKMRMLQICRLFFYLICRLQGGRCKKLQICRL